MAESPPPEPLPVPAPPPGPAVPAYAVTRPANTLAIVSLVAGIACWVVVPVVGAVVAVVTGHMARSQIRRTGESGDGMALAGLILGYVHLALGVLVIGVIILVLVGLVATSSHFASP